MQEENWRKDPPAAEGFYWFRTNTTNGVVMKVEYYQDLQSGIKRHLIAVPQFPYEWSSKPAFDLDRLNGEWLRCADNYH